jgi:hypothetical protein
MKPRVSILMVTSIDGRLHPSRFTASPDGTRRDWSEQYEKVHASLQANAWLVGRVTTAEMSRTGPHAPSGPWKVERPIHVAKTDAATFAVALDPSGKLEPFRPATVGGGGWKNYEINGRGEAICFVPALPVRVRVR